MRLIDANALIKSILAERDKIPLFTPAATYELRDEKHNYLGQALRGGLRKALKCINDAPPIDAVPVVRCKDCKYSMLWRKPTDKVIGDCYIRKMNSENEQFCMVGADDFCSYGERREADD